MFHFYADLFHVKSCSFAEKWKSVLWWSDWSDHYTLAHSIRNILSCFPRRIFFSSNWEILVLSIPLELKTRAKVVRYYFYWWFARCLRFHQYLRQISIDDIGLSVSHAFSIMFQWISTIFTRLCLHFLHVNRRQQSRLGDTVYSYQRKKTKKNMTNLQFKQSGREHFEDWIKLLQW